MSDGPKLQILGISGSLRAGSYNTMALKEAQRLAPADVAIEAVTLHDIPLYNEDVKQQGFPPAVDALRQKTRQAHGVLLVTPEYNYSMSGVIKNAIDWISRPPDQPFADKPIAIMSASPGMLGGARAQYHLRQCFIFLDARVMSRPEVIIASASKKFDDQGRLNDDATEKAIKEMLAGFASWIRRLG